jgi:hypothetical protein
VRTRLASLALVTLLTLPTGAVPALGDLGPATGTVPGSGSAHSLLSAAPGSGSEGSGSGPGGSGPVSGTSGSGSGGPGSDDRRSTTGTSPHHSSSFQSPDSRPGLRAGPEPASQAGASAAEPAPPAAASAAQPSTRAPATVRSPATAAASAPPVGSVADRREGFPRLSTPPSLAAVAGVAGGALLFVAMVAAGFRARARLGRLG